MKKIFSLMCALALISAVAAGQPQKKNKGQWQEKVRAEKIAYITMELNLTEAEAQAFWPVYNDVQNQLREANKAKKEAYKALQDGMEGPDAAKLLDNYLASREAINKIHKDALPRYKKVLSIDKVAKLVLAEEQYRHKKINQLGKNEGGHKKGGHGGFKGPRE